MPTEEWMRKYEEMRDRLTSWADPDSYFTGDMVGNSAVDTIDIGTVSFPSGRILACDPLIELEDRPPFMQTVPPGTYPVTICVMPCRTMPSSLNTRPSPWSFMRSTT